MQVNLVGYLQRSQIEEADAPSMFVAGKQHRDARRTGLVNVGTAGVALIGNTDDRGVDV